MSSNFKKLDKSKIVMIVVLLIIFGGPFAVVGIGILIWYLVSNAKAEREKEAEEEEERVQREKEKDERRWICKRCGASTKGRICEYCDSPYEW